MLNSRGETWKTKHIVTYNIHTTIITCITQYIIVTITDCLIPNECMISLSVLFTFFDTIFPYLKIIILSFLLSFNFGKGVIWLYFKKFQSFCKMKKKFQNQNILIWCKGSYSAVLVYVIF